MAEPTTAPVAAATAGLTLFGVATGLDAATVLAGLFGALLAQSYGSKSPWWCRAFVTSISAILAGYFTPILVVLVVSASAVFVGRFAPEIASLFPDFDLRAILKTPIAALFGLTVHSVLGPAALRFTAKKAEEIIK